MARKSRKITVQQEPPVVAAQVTFATAIYARLSVENSGKQDGGSSLNNQIDVCKEYISGCPYLKLTEVYSDNGKTGTVFDRPAWNRLMEDVKTGKIEAIVVRDLSRFGRDYIEVGNYLEKIFPALGTRFISVKENFDNFTCDGSTESLSVSLQNLINALYSRDISRKVATALMAQQQNGTFRNRNLPYGYVWNEDKTAYAIDEEAAVHVRDIFRWKLEGASINQMLQRLEDSGVSNPELRKRENGLREGDCVGLGWGKSTIDSILQNPVYLGHTVHGKCRSEIYKGRKKHRCPSEEWLVYENTHPALVPQEDFDAVQAMLAEASAEKQRKKAESASIRASMIDLFDKRCFCGDCGKRMYFRRHKVDKVVPEKWAGTYNCSTFTTRRYQTCTNHYMRQEVLEEKVFHAIQDQLKIALDYDKLLGLLKGSTGEANMKEKYNAAVSSVSIKLNALNQKRSRLYDNYVDGTLSEPEYLYAKQTYEAEYERLTALQDEAIQRRNRFLESISPDNRWMHMMKAATHTEVLTQELVDAMIESVLVYENGVVQIELRYDDVYQDMCQSVLEMQGNDVSADVAQTDAVPKEEAGV